MHGGAVSKRQAEKESVTSARPRSIFFGNRLIELWVLRCVGALRELSFAHESEKGIILVSLFECLLTACSASQATAVLKTRLPSVF